MSAIRKGEKFILPPISATENFFRLEDGYRTSPKGNLSMTLTIFLLFSLFPLFITPSAQADSILDIPKGTTFKLLQNMPMGHMPMGQVRF